MKRIKIITFQRELHLYFRSWRTNCIVLRNAKWITRIILRWFSKSGLTWHTSPLRFHQDHASHQTRTPATHVRIQTLNRKWWDPRDPSRLKCNLTELPFNFCVLNFAFKILKALMEFSIILAQKCESRHGSWHARIESWYTESNDNGLRDEYQMHLRQLARPRLFHCAPCKSFPTCQTRGGGAPLEHQTGPHLIFFVTSLLQDFGSVSTFYHRLPSTRNSRIHQRQCKNDQTE